MLKNLLLLAGFSTFVVIVIIGLNIYHNFQESSLSTRTQKHVEQIPATFDKKTLNDLKKRTSIPVNLEEKTSVISEEFKQPVIVSPTKTIENLTSSTSAKPTNTLPKPTQL